MSRTSISQVPHLGPVIDDDRVEDRDRFDAPELGIVLSHYDLGVILRIREYRRGSRRSPKLRLTTERGEFLLKRRAPGRADPRRVAFAQDLQVQLAAHGYPVPGFARTRTRGSSMLQLEQRIYEMFEYVRGTRDDRSATSARHAGRALGTLHRLLKNHRPKHAPDAGSYHGASRLDAALAKVPSMIVAAEPAESVAAIEDRCNYLRTVYHEAAQRVADAGLDGWPSRVVHGDWHPGNLLYRDGEVVAVLDFDSARMEPRVVDVANAALQFSMTMADPVDPDGWPEHLEVKRIRAMVSGYDEAAADPLKPAERQAVPWLIQEALILESVLPIAATGRFATLSGSSFIRMVERKIRWLRPRVAKLVEYVTEPER